MSHLLAQRTAWDKALATSSYDFHEYRCALDIDGVEAVTGAPVHGRYRIVEPLAHGLLIDKEGQNWLVSPTPSANEDCRIIPLHFQLVLDAPLETRDVTLHFEHINLPNLGRSIATVMGDSLRNCVPGEYDDWSMADVRLSGTCKSQALSEPFRIPRRGLARVTFSGNSVVLAAATVNDLLNSHGRTMLTGADLTITLPAEVQDPVPMATPYADSQFGSGFSLPGNPKIQTF